MTAQPFSPAEHYGFSTGLCHIFAAAAHARLGGVPTVLVATDRRQLKAHDWPTDEPLALHVFLQMADGSVVDAEGRRSLDDLLHEFGVRRGYRHVLVPDPAMKRSVAEFGPLSPEWVAVVGHRLEEQGWTPDAIPEATDTLARDADFQAARDAWTQTQMPTYQARVADQAWRQVAQVTPPAASPARGRRP